MTHSLVDIDRVAPLRLPDLWILTIIKPGASPDIHEVLRSMRAPSARTVLVSDVSLSYVKPRCRHVVVPSERDSVLWNAGLDFIHKQQDPGDRWDVLLLDPAYPLTMRSVDGLRSHMRHQEVWMAELDLFGTSGVAGYRTTYTADRSDVHPPVVMFCGESGVRFDRRFFDGADSWAEFCRRTRSVGGSVLVSPESLKESML